MPFADAVGICGRTSSGARRTPCRRARKTDRRDATSISYIFLFAKSPRYYFDYHALEQPIAEETKARYQRNRSERSKYFASSYGQGLEKHLGQVTEERRQVCRGKDVWDISTNAYRMGEHFAMFPEKLVEPCILAGSREGDTVLDPFFGSGTTGAVAKRLGRSCIGIDLNPRYLEKAEMRIAEVIPEKPYGNAADLSEGTTAGGGMIWQKNRSRIKPLG